VPLRKGLVNCLYLFCSENSQFLASVDYVEQIHKIACKLYKCVQNDASKSLIFTSCEVVQHQSTLAKNWLFSEQKRYRQFTRPFPRGHL